MPADPPGATTDDHGSVGDGQQLGPATAEPAATVDAPRVAPSQDGAGGNGQSGNGDGYTRTEADGSTSVAEPATTDDSLTTDDPATTREAVASDTVPGPSADSVTGLSSFSSVGLTSTDRPGDATDGAPDATTTETGASGRPDGAPTGEMWASPSATAADGTWQAAAPATPATDPTDVSTFAPEIDLPQQQPRTTGVVSAAGAVVGAGVQRLRRSRRARHAKKARRGLRVKQRLWSIDPWSVFKVSALFYVCVCLILLIAGTLLWNVGRSVGTIDSVESFVTRMGAYGTCTQKAEVPAGTPFETDDDCAEGEVLVGGFQIDDGTLFKMAAIGGGVLVVAGSIGNVLMVVLLNLLNELTGGMRYTIVKEPVPRGARAGPRGGGPRGPGAGAHRRLAANGSLTRRADG